MAADTAENTVARFVLRARRIEAHSLVSDKDELARYARSPLKVMFHFSGTTTITRELPDEEIFESLAARVRPLTADREPIHFPKVFNAIRRQLHRNAVNSGTQLARLEKLRGEWRAIDLEGNRVYGYALQSADLDGSGATPMVSNTDLGTGWMNTDLVHADPTGRKKDATRFPVRERYAAAVGVYSRVAQLAVSTLRFVENLCEEGAISVDDQAWSQDVIIGVREITMEAAAVHIGPVGATVPDFRETGLEYPEGWEPVTVTDLLRNDPANQVTVKLYCQDGSLVAEHQAVLADQRVEGAVLEWHVLVAGCVMFRFTFELEDGAAPRPTDVSWVGLDSTNEHILASKRLDLEIHEAETMTFRSQGAELTFTPPPLDDVELLNTQVHAQTVEDIVAIETLSGQRFEPCNGPYGDQERIQLRLARLVSEGHIVAAERLTLNVTTLSGKPPRTVSSAPNKAITIGGTHIPAPLVHFHHPDMAIKDNGSAPEIGPDARTFEVSPPAGQRLLAWCPQYRDAPSDEELLTPTPWNLVGIDETSPI